MSEDTPELNTQEPLNTPKSQSKEFFIPLKAIIIACIALLIVATGISGFFLLKKNNSKPISSTQKRGDIGFTVVNEKNGSIYVYNITKSKMSQNPIKGVSVGKYGGAAGLGSTEIYQSPDMTMSALIDSTTHNLFILDHMTLTTKQATTTEDVDYITGWTKNNKYVLYYRGAPDPVSGEQTNTTWGFYLLDVEKMQSKKLETVTSAEALSNDKILTSNNGTFALYDIATGATDSLPFKKDYSPGFFHQIDLSPDALHWTFTRAQTDYKGNSAGKAEIYYAEIGKDTGTLIAQGTFAEVQFPLISPNDDKIVYRSGINGNPDTIVATDIKTGSEIARTSGNKPTWITNDNILILTYKDQEEFHDYKIWNSTKEEFIREITALLPESAHEIVDTSEFPGEYEKRRFDIKKSIEKYITPPEEFQESYDENLIGMKCNTFSNYEKRGWEYTAKYSDGSEHSKYFLKNANIISAIEKTNNLASYGEEQKASANATACMLEDGKIYVERSANYDTYSQPHAFIWSNDTLAHVAKLVYSGTPIYSGCSIVQITKSGEYYYRCGAGDGGYSAMEIQKVTPDSPPHALLSCEFSAGTNGECHNGSIEETKQKAN